MQLYSKTVRHERVGIIAYCVLDSGTVGPWFKSQPRRCRVIVLDRLFAPIVPLFTNQRNWYQPSSAAWWKVMEAYRRVNDSHHLQADCQEPRLAPAES